MIYKNNFTSNNELPQHIQVCINTYKEALENFALNDYKMRLNQNNRDSYDMPNVSYRNAMGNRSDNLSSMRESLKAAFIFASDEAKLSGNTSIIEKVQYEFHSIVSDSIFNGSNAYECYIEGKFGDSKPTLNIEDNFRLDIDNASKIFGKIPKEETQSKTVENDMDLEDILL